MDEFTLEELIALAGKTNEDNHYNGYEKAEGDGYGIEYLAKKDLLEVREISEALEELRAGHPADEVYFSEDEKPEGYLIEKIDAFIRNAGTIYEVAKKHDIPLTEIVRLTRLKMEYNARRVDTARSGHNLF